MHGTCGARPSLAPWLLSCTTTTRSLGVSFWRFRAACSASLLGGDGSIWRLRPPTLLTVCSAGKLGKGSVCGSLGDSLVGVAPPNPLLTTRRNPSRLRLLVRALTGRRALLSCRPASAPKLMRHSVPSKPFTRRSGLPPSPWHQRSCPTLWHVLCAASRLILPPGPPGSASNTCVRPARLVPPMPFFNNFAASWACWRKGMLALPLRPAWRGPAMSPYPSPLAVCGLSLLVKYHSWLDPLDVGGGGQFHFRMSKT